MYDYNKDFNWFEDDTLAKDWFNDLCSRIAWKAFENQEKWVYMIGELGRDEEGNLRKPMIKPEALEVFNQLFDDELNWMKWNTIMSFMKLYHEDDIDYSPEIESEVREYFGEDEDEF